MGEYIRLKGRIISVGDSLEKVRIQAGDPMAKRSFQNRGYHIEKWTYRFSDRIVTVTFRSGSVSGFKTEKV